MSSVVSTVTVIQIGREWWIFDHSGPISGPYLTQQRALVASR